MLYHNTTSEDGPEVVRNRSECDTEREREGEGEAGRERGRDKVVDGKLRYDRMRGGEESKRGVQSVGMRVE